MTTSHAWDHTEPPGTQPPSYAQRRTRQRREIHAELLAADQLECLGEHDGDCDWAESHVVRRPDAPDLVNVHETLRREDYVLACAASVRAAIDRGRAERERRRAAALTQRDLTHNHRSITP